MEKTVAGRIAMENEYIIEMFLDYKVREHSVVKATVNLHKTGLEQFLDFITRTYGGDDKKKDDSLDLRCVTRKQIVDYKMHLEDIGRRHDTVKTRLKSVRLLYEWLAKENHIKDSPYPNQIIIRGNEAKPKLVPTPKQIFFMRMKSVPLEKALAIEILLSTGMRSGEFRQVRMCDIKFRERPIDRETTMPSNFVVATISISKEVSRVKGKNTRDVYVSKIAGRILRRYMEKFGIKENSATPLFPFAKSTLNEWFSKIGENVFKGNNILIDEEERLSSFFLSSPP